VPGRLGQSNSARNPRRTAITAATLMVGIALVTGVRVLGSSLKASIDQLTRQQVHSPTSSACTRRQADSER
jgi:putative ABC transport system permease protein